MKATEIYYESARVESNERQKNCEDGVLYRLSQVLTRRD